MAGHVYDITAPPTRILDGMVWVFDGSRVTDRVPTDTPPGGEAIVERSAR